MSSTTTAKRLDDAAVSTFLKELTKLTRKHGVAIAGCGCCTSPFLSIAGKRGSYDVDKSNGNLSYTNAP